VNLGQASPPSVPGFWKDLKQTRRTGHSSAKVLRLSVDSLGVYSVPCLMLYQNDIKIAGVCERCKNNARQMPDSLKFL
jgi:hypothetical protein